MFVDICTITVKAGNGGNGAVAWRREKYVPAGGPAGGDGGRGGDVVLIADERVHTLMDFRYKAVYRAEHGDDGRGKKQYGKDGESIRLKVPVGTLVKDEKSGKVIVDLNTPGQEYIIARGGKGGKGNARYTNATRQAPTFRQLGFPGDEREIVLELKTLADVGLVGFPNVGKSTFLSIVSAAKPKIANYHFTTLSPNLGVVSLGPEESFVIADIPGLIEGASEGVGLGHDFLRHIERTKVIVHIVDASGSEGRDPVEDVAKINGELKGYNPRLGEKPQILLANKMDLPEAEENLERLREAYGQEMTIYSTSLAMGGDLKKLLYDLLGRVNEAYEEEREELETYDELYVEERVQEEGIRIYQEGGKFIVDGPYMERLLRSTNFDDHESVRYFQENLRKNGVIDGLKELGTAEGDSVFMAGYEFEFFE
ncbi:MAG: GTPase ObgE [Tissierellia bacterium]|nr:GTPase ObgE [Tissierellia bacterium]